MKLSSECAKIISAVILLFRDSIKSKKNNTFSLLIDVGVEANRNATCQCAIKYWHG